MIKPSLFDGNITKGYCTSAHRAVKGLRVEVESPDSRKLEGAEVVAQL